MTFTWRLDPDDTGATIDAPDRTFSSQSDAESWIGEHWRRLSEAGVESVDLVEGSTVVYSMSLSSD